MPVRGGPHAELALEFADALARRHDARIVVLHVIPPGVTSAVRAQAEHALATFLKQHARGHADGVLREAPNVRNAILREAERADVVIMGASVAPEGTTDEAFLFGALPEAVAARATTPVIVVKTRERVGRATFEELAGRAESLIAADRAAEESRAIPARVERWFAESNFHHGEFRNLRRLVDLKQQQGLTVSLVLPTLDEEATIGEIVRRARGVLMDGVPLVDELLVIDSASADRTREIAEAEGARVVQHADVLPRYGSYRGKGEALWKSLYETSGDIVVWCDTDVRNWHPRMAYGTLGPLLTEPRIQYVKGYYQRPDRPGGHPQGGRRRAGDRARRPAAHQPLLPGPVGLHPAACRRVRRAPDAPRVDPVLHRLRGRDRPPHRHQRARPGIDALGQVDLERRVHRNQELEGLSRMSFVILQAVMKRLEERRKARLFAELGSTMKLPRFGGDHLGLEIIELADRERPPMIRIPEYLERRAGVPAE